MEHYGHVTEELLASSKALRDVIPDEWSAFWKMHRTVMADGALSAKSKELVALAVAIVKRCDGCIGYHARNAALQGATAEEVGEMIAVTMAMDGGPATVYGPRAFATFQHFAAGGGAKPDPPATPSPS
jgi:AhpD family alkylhydroperoxidase